MKIIFFSNIPTPYQLDFIAELSEQFEVMGLFLSDREVNRDWKLNRPSNCKILSEGKVGEVWSSLCDHISDFKPDHIIVGGYRLPFSYRLLVKSFLQGTSFHYWLEQPLPLYGVKTLLRKFVWLLTIPFASNVFCIGGKAVLSYKPYSKRCINLPYSIDISKYRVRSQPVSRPLKFLYIGQYIFRKGIDEMLKAFESIPHELAELTLVGSGELEAYVKNFVQKNSHINELGFISPELLPEVIASHDVLLAPSRHDGWGVVVTEAMASGLPVISTYNTGAFLEFSSLCGNSKFGLPCAVNRVDIYNAIIFYVENPDQINNHGANGRKLIEQSLASTVNSSKVLLDTFGCIPKEV